MRVVVKQRRIKLIKRVERCKHVILCRIGKRIERVCKRGRLCCQRQLGVFCGHSFFVSRLSTG